ncbi:GR25 family glycosyltransferase involved in LPS biosynthesis [Variovorax boronicumulans]|uniref:GR25 family glycosyltransferase involved in LPS biosynthesis n=1 Tax=Variovorax boronicumulans TaxID=436515 RepID=A0AAW8DRT4_9BURK|nr:glycosyltransferase family 25 protein [Variovorax boronicumulans]MDP9876885.1 GR25 family glycosyltransferase involved in LPS biosynthesis [Variovorax boronicumulans]MDP9918873.1 GR25 family glycosyltransferase involved in LPS biosynthesis [Variovorax boronicumulans]MDP9922238.1 GR25 family glycosyltransferase involved in LPS biosynthesis [Variovorax boronicumulans]
MQGCYINLERSNERRAAMDAQLQRLGLANVRRHTAIDAQALAPGNTAITPGERACFLSHTEALARANPDEALLVLEDDAQLSEALPAVLRSGALAQLEAEGCDIAFLECQPVTSTQHLLALWHSLQRRLPPQGSGAPRHALTGIDFLDARTLYNWGAVAYVVTPKGLRVLPALLQEAITHGPSQPYDLTLGSFLRDGRLQGVVLSPFLATPAWGSHADSTLGSPAESAAHDVLGGALRRLFFAGPLEGLEAHVAPWRHAPLTDDPQLRLLADLMAQLFVLTARDHAPR